MQHIVVKSHVWKLLMYKNGHIYQFSTTNAAEQWTFFVRIQTLF